MVRLEPAVVEASAAEELAAVAAIQRVLNLASVAGRVNLA
jgi:hypothetical protein